MSKVYSLNFEDSEEHLYKWLIKQPNSEEIIKKLIIDETCKNKENHINSDEDMWNPDYFRIEQKKETMVSIEEIINYFK